MNKKRILIIADSNLSNSGVPMVFMSIVRALKDEFLFDVIITSEDDMFYKDEFLSYGGKIIVFNRNIPNGGISKIVWLLFKLKKLTYRFCNKEIALDDYYAIHSFDEMFSSSFFRLAKKKGVKYRIVHICAAFRAYNIKKSIKLLLLEYDRRKTFKLCTSIACSSDSTLKYNNYKDKGVTLFRTYDEKRFPGVIECSHNNLVLTQIGTFSSRKNQLFSLQLINEIKKTYPNVILNFVGKEVEEGYEKKMNDFINRHSLKENIQYLGTSPNREELSRKTSFIIHPSIMEGSGNVLVESQVCGIHCFASSSLPKGYDLGNVQFLDLDYLLWANKIIEYFNNNKNKRIQPINKERFSPTQFKATVLKMMSNKK